MLEYKVKIFKGSMKGVEKLAEKYEAEMNERAREGWRVHSVTVEPSWGGLIITFERESNDRPSL